MKILHLSASYKPAYVYGGPTMSVSMLCEQLVQAGVQVEVFTTTANGSAELSVPHNVPINVDNVTVTYFKRFTKDHTHFSPSLLATLQKRVKEFDVVHIHAWWNLVSVLGALIAISRNVPVVVSPRGTLSTYSFNNRNSFKKKLMHFALGKKLLRQCFIHATANNEADTARIFKPASINVIPNLVKLLSDSSAIDKSKSNIFNILFFSRIEEKKGLDVLLQAVSWLNFPFALTIAGSGELNYIKKLKALANTLKIGNKVSWVGFVNEHKFAILKSHDLLVLPSYDENFANVVIESLSVGTPVLISNKVGLADYILERQLGWVCPIDGNAFAKCLNQIYHDKESVSRINIEGPPIIKQDFDTERLVEQYSSLYKKISGI